MAQNPIDRLEQLLASLGILIEREAMLEKDNLWAEAEDVQQRMRALVEAITPLAQDLQHRRMLTPKLKEQLNAILAKQQKIFDERAKAMKVLETQLNELKATGAKLNNVRPVYGKIASPYNNGSRPTSLDAQG